MKRVNASTNAVGGLSTELIKYLLAIVSFFHISIVTLSNTVDVLFMNFLSCEKSLLRYIATPQKLNKEGR